MELHEIVQEIKSNLAGARVKESGLRESLIQKLCFQAIAMNPDTADDYADRAFAYRKLKMYNEALADLDLAVDMDSRNPKYRIERGFTYMDVGHIEGNLDFAMNDFMALVKIDPHSPRSYSMRGYCRRKAAEKDQGYAAMAIEDYENALQLYDEKVRGRERITPADRKARGEALVGLKQLGVQP